AARLRAEEEARLAAEVEARRQAEEEAQRKRAEEIAAAEALAARQAESLIERNDGTPAEWVDVDVSGAQVVQHAAPSVEETAVPEISHEAIVTETVAPESKEIDRADLSIVEEPVIGVTAERRDNGAAEKGLATLDEFSSVPGAILKRLSSEEPSERAAAVTDLARVGGDDSFREISAAFDDPAVEVRNAAARSLFTLNPDRAATFTRALREAPPERRRKIGSALASSGLASEAIGQLMGESREKTYDAFSLLFLMSKAGEVQPLMRAIEEHPNNEVRLAVVKLLALSGQQEILPAFRRLAVRGSLPTEVRSAVMEAIYQISSQSPTPA
ncbi:MAG TPA: HEAT repeat domain-containing protein, partial [Pyrinomonadaceae bacterium]|nr:HEAT repeat domain-containing protein [Pyrinomonadaceae bacterium]